MIKKIDHIGIATLQQAEAAATFDRLLGLKTQSVDEVATQKVRVAFLPCADVRLELLEATSPESTVAKFIEKRGAGMHHIAFETDDIRSELARLERQGVALIDREPRPGAHKSLVAFLHPKATHGVLVELVERAKDHE